MSVEAAISAVGGAAAIGGAIDSLMKDSDREKLRSWMKSWWARFNEVNWSNLGKQESLNVVHFLDHWIGRHAWSPRRLVIVFGSAFFILAIRVSTHLLVQWADDLIAASAEPHPYSPIFAHSVFGWQFWLCVALIAIGYDLAISLTRALAVATVSLSKGAISTIGLFVGLIGLQLFLFAIWDRYLTNGITRFEVLTTHLEVKGFLPVLSLIKLVLKEGLRDFALVARGKGELQLELPPASAASIGILTIFALKTSLDWLILGTRILFATIFVISYSFRPLLQAPISNLWEKLIDSNRPFTLVFSAISTVYTVMHALIFL